MSRSALPAGSLRSNWSRAECSESTGMILARVPSANGISRSPAITRLSLLARASGRPSARVATDGISPAAPTTALRTRSGSVASISSTPEPGPLRTRLTDCDSSSGALVESAIAMVSTPNSRAWPARVSPSEPAPSPATTKSSESANRLRACRPIDPVEPRIVIRLRSIPRLWAIGSSGNQTRSSET